MCQFGGNHMLRFALSAIALVGVLETARPAPADALVAMAADTTHVTAATQPAPPAAASSPEATGAANTAPDKVYAPSGFGWG
jgi:hypothetical protein